MIFSALRFCTGLAWDAGEALADWLNCNRAADELWTRAQADRLAESAAVQLYECARPSCHCHENPNYAPFDSSAAGDFPDPAAECQEESPSPADVETPPGLQLTAEELDAAQFVVRRWSRGSRFDDDCVSREFFERLADKLDPAKR